MSDQNFSETFSGRVISGSTTGGPGEELVAGGRGLAYPAPEFSTGSAIARQGTDQPEMETRAGADAGEQTAGAQRMKEWQLQEANRRLGILQAFWKLVDGDKQNGIAPLSRAKAAKKVGVPSVTIWRYEAAVKALRDGILAEPPTDEEMIEALLPKTDECGRKPEYLPNEGELACVMSIYIRLNESRVRGKGLGSSKVTAFRMAAKSEDPRIGEIFRGVVLKRLSKTVPPSWERLLDVPASVLEQGRDKSSLMRSHISTPRGITYVNAAGQEVPLKAGCIFESDDGTVNFPVWIPWPYGGDKCSDRFGCKIGRFQLLPIVDRRSRMCVAWDFVLRSKSSYRGEDIVAIFGRAFSDIGMPEAMCTERASWECELVNSAMTLAGIPRIRAWEAKQKNAVENFFDRLWTPLSLLPGDVGRRRGENKENTDILMQCEAGRRDPREHYMSVDHAVKGIGAGVSFVNSEPVESSTGWGRWIPEQLFMDQTEGLQTLRRLPAQMGIFFSREQREWTVRSNVVGGVVNTPMLSFPIYFQCAELWEFEGCRVKCFFDPFSDVVMGTIVLQEEEWRSYRRGHVIARDVPVLERPPQAVLSADWSRTDELERGLAIRKAMARAVRTEYWNFMGGRRSEARDGFGNSAIRAPGAVAIGSRDTAEAVQAIRKAGRPQISLAAPSQDEFAKRAKLLKRQAEPLAVPD